MRFSHLLLRRQCPRDRLFRENGMFAETQVDFCSVASVLAPFCALFVPLTPPVFAIVLSPIRRKATAARRRPHIEANF